MIWTFSIVPRTFTQLRARDRWAKTKCISLQNRKTLCAVLTGEQRPSTSVIHSGSAVRPELPEPWCSIWEQPAGLQPPPPLPISKLCPSLGRMKKRGKKGEECDAEVLIAGESKVKQDQEASRASASPHPLDTLCGVRYRSSGAPGREGEPRQARRREDRKCLDFTFNLNLIPEATLHNSL